MRRAARTDANHAHIVDGLRKVGAHVEDTSGVGDGFPDIVVGYRGRWYVIEIKDGDAPPSDRRLTPKQKQWHERVHGIAPAHIAYNLEEALLIVGAKAA